MNLELQINPRQLVPAELMTGDRLLTKLAHNYPHGLIAVLNSDYNIVMIDGREMSILGFTPEELVGRSIIGPESILALSNAAILDRAFRGQSVCFEMSKGNNIYEVTAVPLSDDDDAADEILIVLQNITERKAVEQTLSAALKQEKRLMEFTSRFVNTVSHEFRTPLSTILSSVFLLEESNIPDYEQKKLLLLTRIRQTVNLLTATLNDFLRLARIEEGKLDIAADEIAVPQLVHQIIKELAGIKKTGQLILQIHNGIDLPVFLDKAMLRSVIINLLSNAIKYSAEAQQILINTTLTEDMLTISVVDHGIGIPQEEHGHIFERFFRALNAAKIEGTGLGLYIVKQYVEAMNGTVSFESENKITQFTVNISLRSADDSRHLIST